MKIFGTLKDYINALFDKIFWIKFLFLSIIPAIFFCYLAINNHPVYSFPLFISLYSGLFCYAGAVDRSIGNKYCQEKLEEEYDYLDYQDLGY